MEDVESGTHDDGGAGQGCSVRKVRKKPPTEKGRADEFQVLKRRKHRRVGILERVHHHMWPVVAMAPRANKPPHSVIVGQTGVISGISAQAPIPSKSVVNPQPNSPDKNCICAGSSCVAARRVKRYRTRNTRLPPQVARLASRLLGSSAE